MKEIRKRCGSSKSLNGNTMCTFVIFLICLCDHNEIPILNVSTDDVSGNTLEHFYEYLWVNSGYVASRSKDVVTIDDALAVCRSALWHNTLPSLASTEEAQKLYSIFLRMMKDMYWSTKLPKSSNAPKRRIF